MILISNQLLYKFFYTIKHYTHIKLVLNCFYFFVWHDQQIFKYDATKCFLFGTDYVLIVKLFKKNTDVFCEASLGMQKFSTHSIDSANPKWNTTMQFQIYDLNKDSLNVCLYDRKVYSPNVFLGKTELKIIQIYREQAKETPHQHQQQHQLMQHEEICNPITRVFRMSSSNTTAKIMLKMSISIYK